MPWLKTIWSELFGLFVDDGGFAVAIVMWLAVVGIGLKRLGLAADLPPLMLFAGLVLILMASALRYARGRGRR
jgi:hypothetical protein